MPPDTVYLNKLVLKLLLKIKVRGTWGKHCPSVCMDKSAGPYLFKQEQSAGCYSFALWVTVVEKASISFTNNELKKQDETEKWSSLNLPVKEYTYIHALPHHHREIITVRGQSYVSCLPPWSSYHHFYMFLNY